MSDTIKARFVAETELHGNGLSTTEATLGAP
jgi:hypothetical protein